jgi:hypothetical protein
MNEIRRLSQGMPVYDIGNHRVGYVDSVFDGGFALQQGDGTLVLLSSDSLFAVSSLHAWLVCGSENMGNYETL